MAIVPPGRSPASATAVRSPASSAAAATASNPGSSEHSTLDASHHSGPAAGRRSISRREAITSPAGSPAKAASASAASAATSDRSPSGALATHLSRSIGCIDS